METGEIQKNEGKEIVFNKTKTQKEETDVRYKEASV